MEHLSEAEFEGIETSALTGYQVANHHFINPSILTPIYANHQPVAKSQRGSEHVRLIRWN